MGESSAWLAALVISGHMTPKEADMMWQRLSGLEIPRTPSEIVDQVLRELLDIRRQERLHGV